VPVPVVAVGVEQVVVASWLGGRCRCWFRLWWWFGDEVDHPLWCVCDRDRPRFVAVFPCVGVEGVWVEGGCGDDLSSFASHVDGCAESVAVCLLVAYFDAGWCCEDDVGAAGACDGSPGVGEWTVCLFEVVEFVVAVDVAVTVDVEGEEVLSVWLCSEGDPDSAFRVEAVEPVVNFAAVVGGGVLPR